MNENPWERLTKLSQLRVANVRYHNFYWVADVYNNYGLMIQCKEGIFSDSHVLKLKGMQIEIDETTTPNKLLLLLRNKEDWPIFKILCEDLISIANDYEEDFKMLDQLNKRLKRWQKLLQFDLQNPLTPQKQKGLFSELKVLESFISEQIGTENAIRYWTGPLYDKQDFILENTAIEVKSYNSSKHKAIQITSLEQLYTSKENLFLVSLALSEHASGETVEEIVNRINSNIDYPTKEIFEEKLGSYGYIPELKEPLLSLIVDQMTFYKITEHFPKITPSNTSKAIEKVKYTINLNDCREFETQRDSIKLTTIPINN
jgi:hypothetical protein